MKPRKVVLVTLIVMNRPLPGESHQRSWWIVHTQSTRQLPDDARNPTRSCGLFIQPTKLQDDLVDCSYYLQSGCRTTPESHQRSWWIVQ